MLRERRPHRDSRSDQSSNFSDENSPKFKRASKFNLIKNIKLETIKRPSAQATPNSGVATNVAGMNPTGATLVGYKKINSDTSAPIVELGTLSPNPSLSSKRFTTIAASMPSLPGSNPSHLNLSGSMPDLCRTSSLKDTNLVRKPDLFQASHSISESSTETTRERSMTLPDDLSSSNNSNQGKVVEGVSDLEKVTPISLSVSSSDSSLSQEGALQNGYLPGSEENSLQSCTDKQTLGAGDAITNTDNQANQASALGSDNVEIKTAKGNLALPSRISTADSSSSGSSLGKSEMTQDDSGVGSSMSDIRASKMSITSSIASSAVVSVTPDVVKRHDVVSCPIRSTESDTYLSGECTLLELLEEEYERSQNENKKSSTNGKQGGASNSKEAGKKAKSTKGSKLGMGAKRLMGNEKNEKRPPDTLHVSSSSPELSELGSERSRSLVSPVADKTIK